MYTFQYNLFLGMNTWSGWTTDGKEFDTEEEVSQFIASMWQFDHEETATTKYRIVPV